MNTEIDADDDLMTVYEVGRFLGGKDSPLTKSTVHRWVRENRIPKPLRIGARLSRWKRSELLPIRDLLWKRRT